MLRLPIRTQWVGKSSKEYLRRVSGPEGLHGLPVVLHDAHRLPILVRPNAGPPRVQDCEVVFQARVKV